MIFLVFNPKVMLQMVDTYNNNTNKGKQMTNTYTYLGFHPLFDAPELLYQALSDKKISMDEMLDYLANRDDYTLTLVGDTYIAKRIDWSRTRGVEVSQ